MSLNQCPKANKRYFSLFIFFHNPHSIKILDSLVLSSSVDTPGPLWEPLLQTDPQPFHLVFRWQPRGAQRVWNDATPELHLLDPERYTSQEQGAGHIQPSWLPDGEYPVRRTRLSKTKTKKQPVDSECKEVSCDFAAYRL